MEFLLYFSWLWSDWLAVSLLVGGTIGGLILGATPGLSPTMAVALLIPFTFKLAPEHGLILLGAAYTSTVAGGAVSAILLKIPGAPANIATALDGNAMAKNGDGARALHLSFLSSGVGGVIGVLLLIFLTPLLAKWALAFGPAELFWLAILGVTVIGTLDTKSFVKGLLSGAFGFFLATIGFETFLYGTPRFVFSNELSGGIHIIPALIGLFAIPQVFEMFAKGRTPSAIEAITVPAANLLKSAYEVLHNWVVLTIGTFVGVIIGLIPGVGGQIAGLVAYDQAKKTDRDPDSFGQGNPKGVIAAESANNAMVGPSLIPLMVLSIPGSPTAAVLLGGLLIHGIFPGSDIFVKHPQVAWTFINSMLIGQILMVVFGILLSAWAAQIARVPRFYMAPIVLVLALFGAYAVQNSMGDVYIMFALGAGIYFLGKFGFSAAPLVLGLILGKIAEGKFMQGKQIGEAAARQSESPWFAYFFDGMLNWALIALIIASIAYSFWANVIASPPGSAEQRATA